MRTVPKFNKKPPKSFPEFFTPGSDEAYKAQHPVRYAVLVGIGIAVLILPMPVYMILNTIVFSAQNSGWLFLGGAGSFVVGIGLFNIVAAWIGQYLGHRVTFGCFGFGAVLIAVSEVLMFCPGLKKLYREELISYFFLTVFFLFVSLFGYLRFRFSLDAWLLQKSGLRERDFRKLKKGKRNFLWYEAVNREYPFGALYAANKLFTLLFIAAVVLCLPCIWFRGISAPLGVCLPVMYVLLCGMTVFSDIRGDIETYGKPLILFARAPNGGIDSSLFTLIGILFFLSAGYVHMQATAELWNIQLPLLRDLLGF